MFRHLPSTQSLVCFEAAARHESYTRAAQEMALTQSAVSRQILALEERLGVQLFRRTRHGVALTPAGHHYGRQVAHWLQELERDTFDIIAHKGRGGTLSLAAVATFATRWLIPRLPLLASSHPEIIVHIETQTRPFLFADTTFDAALYAGTTEQVATWPGVQIQLLMHECVVPVCSPRLLEFAVQQSGVLRTRNKKGRAHEKGVSAQALARLPLLQQSTRPYGWQQWFSAMGGGDAPHVLDGPRYELFSMTAAAAAQGLGVALIPLMLIEAEIERGDLVIACPRPLRSDRSYYLISPAQTESPALMAFAQWLQEMANIAPT